MFVKEKSDNKKKLECVIYNCLFKYLKEIIFFTKNTLSFLWFLMFTSFLTLKISNKKKMFRFQYLNFDPQ